MCVGAFSPTYLKSTFGAAVAGPLFPTTSQRRSPSDARSAAICRCYNIGSSIFSGVGVGTDVHCRAPTITARTRTSISTALYFRMSGRSRPNFTLNYGLAWNAQTGFYNSDVPGRSTWLRFSAPATGPDAEQHQGIPAGVRIRLESVQGQQDRDPRRRAAFTGTARPDTTSCAKRRPSILRARRGTRSPPAHSRTIFPARLRIGVLSDRRPGLPPGPMPDPALSCRLRAERSHHHDRRPVPEPGQQELPAVAAVLSPNESAASGPFPYPNINYAKQGVEIYPQNFPLARSYQTSLGIQRDLGHGMVLTADWARRQGENVSLGEVDKNLFTRYQGSSTPVPVIPLCKTSPDFNPTDECSTGTITFWTDEGRAIYKGY